MKFSFISNSMTLALILGSAIAVASPERGLEIAKAQKASNEGWGDSQSEMTMVLRTANGRENTRNISLKSLEVLDDGDKSLMVFDEPKDVKGTAFLSFSHVATPDDQWIFLPALKRIKRISSKKKSGSFMGSEFSYEDLASFEVEKYTFTYVKDEACPTDSTLTCHVLESIPTDQYSGYTKLISWIDTKELRTQQVDFYDRKKSKLKTMKIETYELYADKYWRPVVSQMVNHQTGKSTTLKWRDIQLGTGLTDEDFSKNNLKRAK